MVDDHHYRRRPPRPCPIKDYFEKNNVAFAFPLLLLLLLLYSSRQFSFSFPLSYFISQMQDMNILDHIFKQKFRPILFLLDIIHSTITMIRII